MGKKTDAADRGHGGAGSSHQNADKPNREGDAGDSRVATNPDRSRVSGGGGERDRHHTRDPERKR